MFNIFLEKSSGKRARLSDDEISPKKSRKVSSSAPATSTADTSSSSKKPTKKSKKRSSADRLDGLNDDDSDNF